MFDDENEDDECGGQSRYPVMPSLIALQQMKNRLHLAYLGKKLMKWTTLATVKELRKLAVEMTEYFQGYGHDFATAYMLLARSRYYYPSLNNVVVQNVGSQAACKVEIDHRSVAGVKVLSINVIEESFDPNEHLGLERGGTSIQDTKKAWRDLLKLTILMLQEREGFEALHTAHNSANKKQNVLGKLVIPKILNAIAYIKSELEEQEREETFRLKRFKQSKEKKNELIKEKKKKEAALLEQGTRCPVCQPKVETPQEIPPVPKAVPVKKEPSIKEEPKKKEEPIKKPEPITKSEPISKPEPMKKQEPIIKEPNIIAKKPSNLCGCTDPRPELDQSTGKFICPICNLADRNVDINVVACKICLPEVNQVKERADHLMAHINQVLTLSRFYNKTLSGMDKKPSELSYADIKKALENINSICSCPHIGKQKVEEDKPPEPCGCATCASKDIKPDKPQTIDKTPNAPCMTEPPGGGPKDTKPEQNLNDCCKNMLQAMAKKPDAPCLAVPPGGELKEMKPEQTVNDCCKNKLQAIEKKSDAPCMTQPSGDVSREKKPEQTVNDCCKNKLQAIDKKSDAPCMTQPSGDVSKEKKPEQNVNDCCKNKPQVIDKKPEPPGLPEPSSCPTCGSKDVKSEPNVEDCGCKNKPQTIDKKPEAPSLPEPSGCPMCGSKDVKSEPNVKDCGCKNEPQVIDKKPEAPSQPEPSGCPTCGSKDVKSEPNVKDCSCKNKPQSIDKKPEAPSLPEPSSCPMCGSKDVQSEPKTNDCGCNNKPQAIDKKPEAPVLPEPSSCPMCGSQDVKSEPKVNNCGCNNKSQAIDKKPEALGLPEPSSCPMCGSQDVKSEPKVNDCGCNNKSQAIDKKPEAPGLPEPSSCPMCGSKDVKSEPKVNNCGCNNKPQAIDKKPEAPSLPELSGCPICGSKDIKSEEKANGCDCGIKPQAIDTKPKAPCLAFKISEQKPDDCCISKPVEEQPVAKSDACCQHSQDTTEYTSAQETEGVCSCTKPPDSVKEKSCCDRAGIKKSDYHTYNLCSISAISGPCFQSASNLYQPAPPFFYLYSGPYVHSQTGLHPICNGNMIPQIDAIPKKCVCSNVPYPGEYKQDNPIYPCKSANDLASQPSKELCTCESTETVQSLQIDPTAMTYPPSASLPPTNLPLMLAKRVAKASEPYLKKTCLKNSDYPVCESCEDPAIEFKCLSNNSKLVPSQIMSCSCKSIQQQTSFSCNSCSTLCSRNLTKSSSSQEVAKPPYFKKSNTYFADIPQGFLPLLSNTVEETSNTVSLSSTSISSDSAHLNLTKDNSGTLTESAFNKFTPKQFMCFLPYTLDGTSRSCDVSEMSLITSSYGITQSDYYNTDKTPGCCIFSKEKCITGSLHDISQKQSHLLPSRTQVVNPEFSSISPINLCDSPDSQSQHLVSNRRYGVPGTQSISSLLDCILFKQCKSSATQNNQSIKKASSTPKTQTKDFSIYITMTPHDHSPYKRQQDRPCNAFETTDATKSNTFKDCSTFVTVAPKIFLSCPGKSPGVSETLNRTEFFKEITHNEQYCCGFTMFNQNDNCISFNPFTREGKPGPCGLSLKCDVFSKNYALNSHKERSGTDSVQSCGNKQTVLSPSFTCKNRSEICDVCEKNNMPLPWSGTGSARLAFKSEERPGSCGISQTKNPTCLPNHTDFKQCTNARPVPHSRERKLAPCGLCGVNNTKGSVGNISSDQLTNLVPYTREGRPGPCGLSTTNANARQFKHPAPYTREGRAGPFDICKINNNVRHFTDPAPYTREGRAGPCDISETNNDLRQLTDPARYTREGRAGPCDVCKKKNNVRQFMDPTSYARKGGAGPCDISKKNNDSNQLTDPTPYTREGRAGRCDTCKTNNSGRQFADPAPYTREGRAGPCDISKTNNDSRQLTDPAPYTREGRAGPCDISKTNNDSTKLTDPVPFTREGRAGPYDIPKVNETAVSHTNLDPRQFTCQGQQGPCPIFETKNTASFLSKISSKFAPNILQHREPCNVCVKNNMACSLCAMDPRESTNQLPFTKEGYPEAYGVSKTNPIASSLYNTTLKHFSHNTPNTTEGVPGVGGVTETNFADSQNKTTPQSAYIEPYIREGKPGPCGLCPHKCKSPLEDILSKQFTAPGSFTREGRAGPCDISKTNNIANQVSKITSKQSIHFPSHARNENSKSCSVCSKCAADRSASRSLSNYAKEGISGSCGVSEMNNIARSFCNLFIKNSSHVTLYSQKGTLGLSETIHIVCSINNNDSEESKNLQTCPRKVGYGPCSVIKSSPIHNTSSKQCTHLTPCTRESKPGPCGVSETNHIAGSNCNELMKDLNRNQSRNFSPFITVDIPKSCSFSERKNTLNSLCNRTSKPYAHVLPNKGVNKLEMCSDCERNGIACPICNIDRKESTNSVPYTREEIPGPCGVSETSNVSSLGKDLKPYTREGLPGPCGISEKALTFPRCKLYASYACQLNPGPWNILESSNVTDASNIIASVHKPCKIESQLQLGQRRSSDNNKLNFCGTQSHLMDHVHTTCGTYTRDKPQYSANTTTKDAATYVTAAACPVRNIREASLKNCGTCDRKITFDTSTPYDSRNYRARAPHTCVNVTRSLNALPRFVCSSCKPYAKTSAAPVMILPSHVLSMASSAAPSRTCGCKSQISSVSTSKPGQNSDEPLYSVGSNKFCSACGRTATNKANLQTTSVPFLKSVTYANCDKCASSHISIHEPCSDCRKARLFLSCASNPSTKSIAVGTCASRNRCTSSKAAFLPISVIQTPCPFSQNTAAIISCPTCYKKKREKYVCHASALGNINKQSYSSLMSKDSKIFIDELKFGYFEIGKKKVTKIYRRKNPDGTITDEKRVIVIKTEKKCPEKLEASGFEAGTKSDCLKNNANRKRNKNEMNVPKFSRQSKSDTCCKGTNDSMTYPQIRYCISTQDCNNMAVNNNCHGPSHNFSKNDTCFVATINRSNTVTHPYGAICINRLEDTDSGPKCDYSNKSSTKPSKLGCANCFPGIKSGSKCSSASIAHSTPAGPVCANRLEDTDSGSKCVCGNKSHSESTTQASLARPVPPTSVCYNRVQDTDSSRTCGCPEKSRIKPSFSVQPTISTCANRLQDSGPRCSCADKLPDITTPVQPITPICGNRLQDSDSVPKYDCASKSTPKPPTPVCTNRLQDTDSGTKCDCANKLPPLPATVDQSTTPVCTNRLENSDSRTKGNCADKSLPEKTTPVQPTTPVCGNRLQDSESGPKCDCASKSTPKPITPVCANRLQDSESGPKCDCANKSLPETTTPVCANRLNDTDSGPKCDCENESSPLPATVDQSTTPVCANRLEDTDSGPKCHCPNKLTPKPAAVEQPTNPVCANRLEDSDSGPKCDCASKSTPKPTAPVCANREQDTDSGPKCDCANKSSPLAATKDQPVKPVCANRLEDTDSGPKCHCPNKSIPKPTTVDQPTNPVCANRLEDTDSGPKCHCSNKSNPKPAAVDQPTNPVCANRLEDSDSGPKCDCASQSNPKPTTPVCANRLEDSDSGPKCDCENESSPLPATVDQSTTPVCANRLEDTDSGPKCHCLNKSTPKPAPVDQPTNPICTNRLEDSDSGPKCDCASKSTPKPTTPVCTNREQDTDSGPKCDCANKLSLLPATKDQPVNPICANRLEDTDSGPKCYCPSKSTPKPAAADQPTNPVCANRLEDSDSGPKCDCASKSTPKPTTPVCANKKQDTDSGPKCDCANKSSHLTATKHQPVNPVCTDRQQVPDSGPKCSCANKSPPLPTSIDRPTTPVCAKRLEDSDSGLKCDCASNSTPKPITSEPQNSEQHSHSRHICDCANKSKSLPASIGKPTTPICGNKLQYLDSSPKCDCARKLTWKPTISASSKQSQTKVCLPKGSCDNNSPPSPTCPMQKSLNPCQCEEINELLPSAKSQDKEVCCSLQKKLGIMKHLSDVQEDRVKDNKEFGYVYIVPSKKAICNKAPQIEVPCSAANIDCCTPKLSYDVNVPISPKKTLGHSSPAKIVPKSCKNRCCSTSDAGKLSIFRGGSMLDALRQLFQSSNSRTQNRKSYDKNICKTCYSPLSDSNDGQSLNTPLCTSCKEKLIDENEQDYRLTNYSTEPGSPASKRSPSPFGQMSFLSANVDHCCPAMVSTVISTDSNDSLICKGGENHCCNANSNDAATSTRVKDETYIRAIKKGKIEHACFPDVKDCSSHTTDSSI